MDLENYDKLFRTIAVANILVLLVLPV